MPSVKNRSYQPLREGFVSPLNQGVTSSPVAATLIHINLVLTLSNQSVAVIIIFFQGYQVVITGISVNSVVPSGKATQATPLVVLSFMLLSFLVSNQSLSSVIYKFRKATVISSLIWSINLVSFLRDSIL